MQAKRLIDSLRSALSQELQTKTGWGRNEVMQAFERAASNTLGELVQISGLPTRLRTEDTSCTCGPTESCGLCE